MTYMAAWRDQIRSVVGRECLLRRDQSARALFVCDFPRRCGDCQSAGARLEALGFRLETARGLWHIDLSEARRAAFLSALPPCAPAALPQPLRSLARSLLAQGDVAAALQPWPPLLLTLLRLETGDFARLYAELSAVAARCKRLRAPLPSAAARLIQEALAERPRKEPSC